MCCAQCGGEMKTTPSVAGSDKYEWRFSTYAVEPGQTSGMVALALTDPDLEPMETYDSPSLR